MRQLTSQRWNSRNLHNSYGRLRGVWRLLVFVLAFLAINFLLVSGLRVAYAIGTSTTSVPDPWSVRPGHNLPANLSGFCLGRRLFVHTILEGLPWRALGLTFHAGWFRTPALLARQ